MTSNQTLTCTGSINLSIPGGPPKFDTWLVEDGASYWQAANESQFDREHNQPFTIAFWFRYRTGNSRQIISKRLTTSNNGILININATANKLLFRITCGGVNKSVNTVTTLSQNQWYHIVVTFSGNSNQDGMKIYLMGVLDATGTSSTMSGTMLNDLPVTIAADGDGSAILTGDIVDLYWYNSELSEADITNIYNNISIPSGYIAHYNFNNNINDDSGNGNHLSLISGTTTYEDDRRYASVGLSYLLGRLTEASTQRITRIPGTHSNLAVIVNSSGTNRYSDIIFRVNGADSALKLTLPVNTVGTIENTTDSVHVTSGDLVNWKYKGWVSTVTITAVSTVFISDSQQATLMSVVGPMSFTTASAQGFIALTGRTTASTATEVNTQLKIGSKSILKHLAVYVCSNARVTNTTFGSRINGTNGNCLVTVGGGVVGYVENTTDYDIITPGDLVNLHKTTGTGVGTLTIDHVDCVLLSINREFMILSSIVSGSGTSAPNAFLYGWGSLSASGTITNSRSLKSRLNMTLSKLHIGIATNTLDNGATGKLKLNESTYGNQTVPIGVGVNQTILENTTDSDVITSGDKFEIEVDASASTTGTVSLRTMGIMGTITLNDTFHTSSYTLKYQLEESIAARKEATLDYEYTQQLFVVLR